MVDCRLRSTSNNKNNSGDPNLKATDSFFWAIDKIGYYTRPGVSWTKSGIVEVLRKNMNADKPHEQSKGLLVGSSTSGNNRWRILSLFIEQAGRPF